MGARLELHDVRVAAALQHGDFVPEAAALLLAQVVQHLDGHELHAAAHRLEHLRTRSEP